MEAPISTRSQYVDNLILSTWVLLSVAAPLYVSLDPGLLLPSFFPIFGGLALVLLGRFSVNTILVLAILFLYVTVIVIGNGFGSVRLGLVSSIFLGLMFSRSRVLPVFLWVSLIYVFWVLYGFTDAFQTIDWQRKVTDTMSLNYFGEALSQVLLAAILSGTGKGSSRLALAILVLSLLASVYVASRQLALIVGFAAIYLLTHGRRASIPILLIVLTATVAASVVFLFDFQYLVEDFAVVNKLAGMGLNTARADIYSCYLSNLSATDILIGSDHTVAGDCAESIVMAKYLHSGYLEAIAQMGFLGVVMVVSYPFAIAYFAYRRRYNVALALTLAGAYQFVETGTTWTYFMILFLLLEDVRASRARCVTSSVPAPQPRGS